MRVNILAKENNGSLVSKSINQCFRFEKVVNNELFDHLICHIPFEAILSISHFCSP